VILQCEGVEGTFAETDLTVAHSALATVEDIKYDLQKKEGRLSYQISDREGGI
jgi:hypothetical protein